MVKVGSVLHVTSLGKSFNIKSFTNEQRKYCGLTAVIVSDNFNGTFKVDVDNRKSDWTFENFMEYVI